MQQVKKRKEISVLLVEDDEGHARLISKAFNAHRRRFDIKTAATLEEAKSHLSGNLPDIVIADINLPDGKGTSLLDTDENEPQFPLIVITGFGDEQMAVDVIKSGALDYIVKMDSALRDMPRIALRTLREWENITHRKRMELMQSTLYKISEVANSDVGLTQLYRSIHENIGRLIDTRNFYIALHDPKTGTISLPYFVDEYDEYDDNNDPHKFGRGLTEQVLSTGKPILVDEEESRQFVEDGKIELVGPAAKIWLGVPLKSGKKTFGALVVQHYSDSRAYTERDKDMLMFVSGQIAAVIRRRQAEQALKNSEKKYRMLFNSMMDAFAFHEAVYDEQGKFVDYKYLDINRMYEKIIGLKREEIIGKPVQKLFPDRRLIDIYSKVTETGEPVRFEYYHKTAGRYYEVHAYRPEPDTFAAVFSDITGRKQAEKEKQYLEEKIINLKKMEAIGRLAGGVAHDLNNVLSAIVSYPDILLMKLPEDSPIRKPILTMQKSGQKAAAIVQDMLTLARRGVAVKEIVDLKEVLTGYLLSPEHEKIRKYHSSTRVITDFGKNLLNIKGSFIHITKTIMNLISNAAEAMPTGGNIFICLENRYVDSPLKAYDLSIEEGDYVVFTVADSGVGISNEDIKKIFEPFYTKKEMGRSGTGLGMTVVWGTVQEHGGYIDVTSSRKKGTCIEVYFPATRETTASKKADLPIEDYIGSGEKILVVDDIKEQRDIAKALLTTLGYTVDTAAGGVEAIEYIKNNSTDLLILDMIMEPGIDGLDTYKEVIKLVPKIKTIIASGFSETDRVREAQRLGAGTYIKKPYTLEKIGLVVKSELSK